MGTYHGTNKTLLQTFREYFCVYQKIFPMKTTFNQYSLYVVVYHKIARNRSKQRQSDWNSSPVGECHLEHQITLHIVDKVKFWNGFSHCRWFLFIQRMQEEFKWFFFFWIVIDCLVVDFVGNLHFYYYKKNCFENWFWSAFYETFL